jgi:hypothetical protein
MQRCKARGKNVLVLPPHLTSLQSKARQPSKVAIGSLQNLQRSQYFPPNFSVMEQKDMGRQLVILQYGRHQVSADLNLDIPTRK